LWGVFKGELQPCPALTPEFLEMKSKRVVKLLLMSP